jgi:hypothetical protein
MNSRFIIGGDFNAKHTHWGSRLITTKSRELHKAVTDAECEIVSTGKPTYSPTDYSISLLSKIFQQTILKLKKVLHGNRADHSKFNQKTCNQLSTKSLSGQEYGE